MIRNEGSLTQAISKLSPPDRIKRYELSDVLLSVSQSRSKLPRGGYAEDYWECQWDVLDILGKVYAVSNRHLSRWGCSSASIGSKLYLFGGRGLDSRPRSSLHVLDLENNLFTFFRALNLPCGREGHSMTSYKNLLIIFGGCQGGKDDTESFDDLWVVDVETKTPNQPLVSGKKPKGREGHAAGVIKNQMIIYGGKGGGVLFSDIFACNLTNFEWKELEQQGELPGIRESMSSTVILEKLYVFGGNISKNLEVDEYTNDLFVISVRGSTAFCKKILSAEEKMPPKRLSHSMSNLNNHFLIVCGGESYGVFLNDVWAFSLELKTWREILPSNQLKKRMAHTCFAYKDSLLVFGGMGEDQVALSELAILKFKKPPTNGVLPKSLNSVHHTPDLVKAEIAANIKPADYFCCNFCNHNSISCSFFERFPEIGSSNFNFYPKVQILPYSLEGITSLFHDSFSAILRIGDLLESNSVFIDVMGTLHMRGDVVCKFMPPNVCIDLTIAPLLENDEEGEFRTKMLSDWRSNEGLSLTVLEIHSKTQFMPDKITKMCVGTIENNFGPAVFKVSEIGLVIARTEEYTSVFLMKYKNNSIALYCVIFNRNKTPEYPSYELYHSNISNILANSHLTSIGEIFEKSLGTYVYLYCKEIVPKDNDLFYGNNSLLVLLSKAVHIKYCLLGSFINFDECNKIKISESPLYSLYKTENSCFSMIVYFNKRLVYWEYKNCEKNKRPREECLEIKIRDKNMLNKAVGLLDWNIKTMQMLSDIFPSSKKVFVQE